MPFNNETYETKWKFLGMLSRLAILLLMATIIANNSAIASEKNISSITKKMNEVPNPHWNQNYCTECHLNKQKKDETLLLRENGDILKLCNRCHSDLSANAYIHATGMVPSDAKLERMEPEFKEALYRGDSKGKLTCIVCHDLTYQCLKKKIDIRRSNPLFFRKGPYVGRTEICYKCHEPVKYVKLNPHDMISDEGEILTSRCVVCHEDIPDVKKVKSINDVNFKVEKNLERLCRRCHYTMKLHPGTFVAGVQARKRGRKGKKFSHLRIPSRKILKNLKITTVREGITMPLEPGTGKIFCATCHNPHERGIQFIAEADRGADNTQRLRAGREGGICLMCHLK